jgi:hypothetical protein
VHMLTLLSQESRNYILYNIMDLDEIKEKLAVYDIFNFIVKKTMYTEIQGYLVVLKEMTQTEEVILLIERINMIQDPNDNIP